MTIDTVQKSWNDYLAAYADVGVAERERLLRQSVVDQVVFTNSTGEGQSFGNLVEHIRQFQKKSPGAYFKSNDVLTHHDQLLARVWPFSGDIREQFCEVLEEYRGGFLAVYRRLRQPKT